MGPLHRDRRGVAAPLVAGVAGSLVAAAVGLAARGEVDWALVAAIVSSFGAFALVRRMVPLAAPVRLYQPQPARSGSVGGPFDRFNDRAKRVLALSQDEAVRFNHNYIGTEHLALGLVREGEGIAAQVLTSLGVELPKIRAAVERIIGRGESTTSPSEITLSPRTKKVIELAVQDAASRGHSHVGTEHLLLALLREGEGIGAHVLVAQGLTIEQIRAAVLARLGAGPPPNPA